MKQFLPGSWPGSCYVTYHHVQTMMPLLTLEEFCRAPAVDSMIFVLSLHGNRFIDYTQFLEIHILSVQITVSYTRYFDLIPTLDLAKAY